MFLHSINSCEEIIKYLEYLQDIYDCFEYSEEFNLGTYSDKSSRIDLKIQGKEVNDEKPKER